MPASRTTMATTISISSSVMPRSALDRPLGRSHLKARQQNPGLRHALTDVCGRDRPFGLSIRRKAAAAGLHLMRGPTDDVGIVPLTAGLPVSAVRNNVRLVPVVA